MTLWSRRFSRGTKLREVTVREREVVLEGTKERWDTLGPGWSFVRGAKAVLGLVQEGFVPADAPGEHRFHPLLPVVWDPAQLSHPAVEVRVGEALLGPSLDDALLLDAGPLVLLEWPVGFRFGEIFEARLGSPVAEEALSRVASTLASEKVRLPSELARLCALQKNAAALPALLTSVERGATFDGWMDVIDLAAEVGEKSDAATLKRLARGRVAADVREALLAVAKELERG
jgi:hypothetical protein